MLAQALQSWSGKKSYVTSPYQYPGVRATAGVTNKHTLLIWECMLGTVEARNPFTGETQYFDYDWDGAQKFARLDSCEDIRLCRKGLGRYSVSPGGKVTQDRDKLRLYGIPKESK